MADFLMRDQAPLTAEEWQAVDSAVTQVARRSLVARRFLTLVGPIGAGVQSIAADLYGDEQEALVSLFGAEERSPIGVQRRRFVPVPMLYRDWALSWRDLESARRGCGLLDTTGAAVAAALVAAMEDRLIVNGHDEFQQQGFLNAEGRQQLPLGDWGVAGAGFRAVVSAAEALVAAGFQRPYTAVLSPQLLAQLNRVFETTGVLELERVERLVGGGVYATPALAAGAVVAAAGSENMDLVIGQDMVVAFLETTSMEHRFRVLETLSLRIKRPGAVVVLS